MNWHLYILQFYYSCQSSQPKSKCKALDHLKCACTCSRGENFIYFLIDFLSAAIPLLSWEYIWAVILQVSTKFPKQLQVLPLNLVTLLTHCLVYICLRLGKSKAGQEHKNKAGKKLTTQKFSSKTSVKLPIVLAMTHLELRNGGQHLTKNAFSFKWFVIIMFIKAIFFKTLF